VRNLGVRGGGGGGWGQVGVMPSAGVCVVCVACVQEWQCSANGGPKCPRVINNSCHVITVTEGNTHVTTSRTFVINIRHVHVELGMAHARPWHCQGEVARGGVREARVYGKACTVCCGSGDAVRTVKVLQPTRHEYKTRLSYAARQQGPPEPNRGTP